MKWTPDNEDDYKFLKPSRMTKYTRRASGIVECAGCSCDQQDNDDPCRNKIPNPDPNGEEAWVACGCTERRIFQFVIVCTDKLGVFQCLADASHLQTTPIKSLTVYNSRMAYYWDSATHGVWSLAATGPTSGCRITAAVPIAELCDIHAVYWLTEKAIEKWEEEPWALT